MYLSRGASWARPARAPARRRSRRRRRRRRPAAPARDRVFLSRRHVRPTRPASDARRRRRRERRRRRLGRGQRRLRPGRRAARVLLGALAEGPARRTSRRRREGETRGSDPKSGQSSTGAVTGRSPSSTKISRAGAPPPIGADCGCCVGARDGRCAVRPRARPRRRRVPLALGGAGLEGRLLAVSISVGTRPSQTLRRAAAFLTWPRSRPQRPGAPERCRLQTDLLLLHELEEVVGVSRLSA